MQRQAEELLQGSDGGDDIKVLVADGIAVLLLRTRHIEDLEIRETGGKFYSR